MVLDVFGVGANYTYTSIGKVVSCTQDLFTVDVQFLRTEGMLQSAAMKTQWPLLNDVWLELIDDLSSCGYLLKDDC